MSKAKPSSAEIKKIIRQPVADVVVAITTANP